MIVMLPIQAIAQPRLSSSLLTTTPVAASTTPRTSRLARSRELHQSTFLTAPPLSHGCVATGFSKHPGNRTAPILTVARFERQPSAAAVPSTALPSSPNPWTIAHGPPTICSCKSPYRACQNTLHSLPTQRALPRRREPSQKWPVQTSRRRS